MTLSLISEENKYKETEWFNTPKRDQEGHSSLQRPPRDSISILHRSREDRQHGFVKC